MALLVQLDVPEGVATAVYEGIRAAALPAAQDERLALGRAFIDQAVRA